MKLLKTFLSYFQEPEMSDDELILRETISALRDAEMTIQACPECMNLGRLKFTRTALMKAEDCLRDLK
jgi:hypothetical protein